MITKETILNATGDELSRLAGEVLGGGKQKHEWSRLIGEKTFGYRYRCSICRVETGERDDYECPKSKPFIPLTWPEAMRLRDWAVGEYGVPKYMLKFISVKPFDTDLYVYYAIAQPEHFIKAACLTKLGGE